MDSVSKPASAAAIFEAPSAALDSGAVDHAEPASRVLVRMGERGERAGPCHALAIGLALLGSAVLAFALWQAALRLPQRFELDYGEGFVWSQVADLLAGRIYRPLAEYPHAIMHYTPLYHAVVAVLWRLGFDPLIAGRVVSLLAGTALAVECGLLAALGLPERAPRAHKIIAGAGAAALILGMPETVEWSTAMRVDMLAASLGTLGLLALRLRDRGPAWSAAAGLCFLLALLTKQNAAVPAIAGIGALLVVQPRSALRLGGALAAIGLALIAIAEALTHGEFLRHTVLYDAARFSWAQLTELGFPLMAKAALPVLVAAGFAGTTLHRLRRERRWRNDPAAWSPIALSLYLVLGLISGLGIGKVGAGSNYMLPLLVPAAVLAGMALAELPRYAPALLAALLVVVPAGLASYPFQSRAELAAHDRQDAELLEIVRAAPGPVLCEDMTLLMRAGRPVPWEFGSITELTRLGIIDETPLVKRLDDGFFDTLIVYTWEPQRFTEAIRSAAQTRYEQVASVGEFDVWRRKAR
jgi:hypothetical protein